MTDAEALEIAVARTGHRRYAELLDPAHPDYDPSYWAAVRKIADPGCEELTSPTIDSGRDWSAFAAASRAAKACPLREGIGDCQCTGYCSAGKGRETVDANGRIRWIVSVNDCIVCKQSAARPETADTNAG